MTDAGAAGDAGGTTEAGAGATEGAEAGDLGTEPGAAGGAEAGGDAGEPGAAGPGAPEGGEGDAGGGEPPAAAAKTGPNLTARLAKLSREKREQQQELRRALDDLKTTKSKAEQFESALAAAKNDDAALIDLIEKTAGVSFERVVDAYAKRGEPQTQTPEQQTAKAIEDLRSELAAERKAREEEAKAAAERTEQARRAEMVGGIAKTVKDNAAKFEICARLGDEAAGEIFAEVTKAWDKAGRPQLMPGEFDDAVMAAADLVELRYTERGKLLAKGGAPAAAAKSGSSAAAAKTNGAAGAAAAEPATKKGQRITRFLPGDFFETPELSDTDKGILEGLRDARAPMASAGKPKPRTINSGLGGSAPPNRPPRGSQDPRDALRDVLSLHGLAAK